MAKLKIGVFGCRRGGNYVSLMASRPDDIEVVALCDRDIEKLSAKDTVPGARCFTDFDEFLRWGRENGMQAVFLANYFHQHAPFAIKCMEAGMDVVSECTSASTLKECVELVECVERTGRKYMIAENRSCMRRENTTTAEQAIRCEMTPRANSTGGRGSPRHTTTRTRSGRSCT